MGTPRRYANETWLDTTKAVLNKLVEGTEKYVDYVTSGNVYGNADPTKELPLNLLADLLAGDSPNNRALGAKLMPKRLEIRFTAYQDMPVVITPGEGAPFTAFITPAVVLKLFIFQSSTEFKVPVSGPYKQVLEFPGNTESPICIDQKPNINVMFERQYLVNSHTPSTVGAIGTFDKYNAAVHDEIIFYKSLIGTIYLDAKTADVTTGFAVNNGYLYALVLVNEGDLRVNLSSRLIFYDMS